MVAIPFQVEHGVDDVFQHARSGDRACLGHVPHQENGHVLRLGCAHQCGGALAYLADTARRGAQFVEVHGLDRIDDHRRRPELAHVLDDCVQVRLGQYIEVVCRETKPARTHLDLLRRLFAGHIEQPASALGQLCADLQQEGRLADSRVPADQDQRAGNDAPAQHAGELGDGDGDAH